MNVQTGSIRCRCSFQITVCDNSHQFVLFHHRQHPNAMLLSAATVAVLHGRVDTDRNDVFAHPVFYQHSDLLYNKIV